MKITESQEGSFLEVFVKPRSKEFKIAVEEGDIIVFCTESPIRGKANREIVKELSRVFHKKVEIVSGFASRHKKLLIRETRRSEIEGCLAVHARR